MPVPRSRLITLVAVSLGVLIAAAVGLLVSLSAFAKPVYLRGPGPQVGQVYRDEVTLVLTDGTVRLSSGGVTDTGRVSIRSEGVFEEEILAVTDGEILKSRTKVIRDHSTEAVTFDGETNTHEEVSKLVGEMIEVGKVGEAWKRVLVGKTASAEQAEEVRFFPPAVSSTEFFPAEAVRPGRTWQVEAGKIRKLLGIPKELEIDGGHWTLTFVRMVRIDGADCAEIAEELELRARFVGGKEAGSLQFRGRGVTHRAVATGVNVDSRFDGTLSVTDVQTVDGQAVQREVSGPVVIQTRTRLH